MTPAEKKALRARWSEELILRINEPIDRSTPRTPSWPLEELKRLIPSHVVDGQEYVDLRGFTFYHLRNVNWSSVDLRACRFQKGRIGPRLVATGVLGCMTDRFSGCLFDFMESHDSNKEGHYEACRFERAKLTRMDFFHRYRATRCSFVNADLTRAKMIGDVIFTRCDFTRAKLKSANITGGVRFEDCRFDDAIFDGAAILNARFRRCSMSGVSMRGVLAEDNVFEEMEPPEFSAPYPSHGRRRR